MATKRTSGARTRNAIMNGRDTLGGFTIIEVVLVLAIAGLIFLMVFIALPQLQSAQRNTQRREDMSKLNSAVIQYQANNNGKLPTDSAKYKDDGDLFIKNYITGEFIDPDGNPYEVKFVQNASGFDGDNLDEYTMYIVGGVVCGEDGSVLTAKPRDFAVLYKLEGSGVYCNDNGGQAATSDTD